MDNPDYGHVASIDFDDEFIDGLEGIKRTQVFFDKNGLTIRQPRGKTLFIPEKYFTGGR